MKTRPKRAGFCIRKKRVGKTAPEKGGLTMKKEEEKKPVTWEVADPKLPVVRSGHLEDRSRNHRPA